MGTLYDVVGAGALALVSPYLLWRGLRHPAEMAERWGGGSWDRARGGTWWHAASVGELEALGPVLRLARSRRPATRHAVTCLTPTGRRRAASLWGSSSDVGMVPLDWTPFVRRRMDRLDPAALVLVETELWPALLREARRRGLPTGIVNGRVSDRTFSRYMALRPLFKPLLEVVRCVGARSSHDAAALAALGVPEGRILVTGNTKYELPQADPAPAPWIARPRWTALFVFGSLRSGELEHVRRALDALARDLPDPATALVLLAPRHPDRAARFVEAARALGLPVTLRSRIDSAVTPRPRGPFVVVVDTLGELRDLWPLATAGFVGGTLTPVGGHNLFEPAARGCPTLFGPSLETVADVASALLQTGGGRVVADGDRLGRTLCELAALPSEREEMSRRALEAAERLGGAAEATVGWLERWGLLPGAGDPVP